MSTDPLVTTDYLRTKIEPLRINQITHYAVCEKHKNRHKLLGVSLIVLSTVSLAFTFFEPPSTFPIVRYLPAIVSMLVAVISVVLAFVNNNAQAEDHQSSAIAYGALLRECEARVSGAYSEVENKEFLQEFQAKWHSVSATSPLTRLAERNQTK